MGDLGVACDDLEGFLHDILACFNNIYLFYIDNFETVQNVGWRFVEIILQFSFARLQHPSTVDVQHSADRDTKCKRTSTQVLCSRIEESALESC